VSQAFYRKWRPRTFDQVVGQDHVTQTLRNALQQSRIVHAYLFGGPRGTGKTSTARILAKAVNCLSDAEERPCNHCVMCQAIDDGRAMDLIEIDAASHTGVDHIRELRDKISFAPAEARYKFYIIDEAHMLSPSAFNALLKTLEEPPAHAILVLATTEAYKIPATVISRCQRFDFRRIPLSAMVDRLQQIAGDEGLQAEDGVFELIARQSTGSMRDAESLLDQLATFTRSEITLAQVQTILGTTSSEAVGDLVRQVNAGDLAGGLGTVNRALAEGADPRQLSKDLLEYLRGLLLVKSTGHAPPELTKEQAKEMTSQASRLSLDQLVLTIKIFNQAAIDLKDSAQPQLPLELALVEAILEQGPMKAPGDPADSTSGNWEREASALPRTVSGPKDLPSTASDQSPLEGSPKEDVAFRAAEDVAAAGGDEPVAGNLEQLRDAWTKVVAAVNRQSMHLAAVVRGCPPMAIEEDIVILHAGSPFHKEKLESDRARQLVEEGISETLGRPYRVKCVLQSDAPGQGTKEEDLERLIDDPMIRAGLELGGEIGTVEKRAP
jgi:DNA polymerase-3 subunit gamma/tau